MRVVYLGYFSSQEVFDYIQSNKINNMSQARYNFESELIKRLSTDQEISQLKIFNYLPIKSSHDIRNIIKMEKNSNTKMYNLYVNKKSIFSLLKNTLLSYKALRNQVKLAENETEEVVFLHYAINPIFAIPCIILRVLHGTKNVTICSEHPLFRRYNKSMIGKLKSRIINVLNNQMDKYILLAPKMKDYTRIKGKKNIVIPGLFLLNNKSQKNVFTKSNEIVYAGGLSKDNGIENLIKAFMSIKNNKGYSLHIYGTGELKSLCELSADNKTIFYNGQVTYSEVQEIFVKSKILVNARDNNTLLSKMSFPSKIVSYLASETLIITTALDAFPKELHENLITIENNSVESIRNSLIKAISLSDKEYDAKIARQNEVLFLFDNKNIYKEISDLLNKE